MANRTASKVLLFSAIILFLIGIFLFFSAYQLEIWANVPWNIGACALGASVIGVSIGFLALYVSLKSDERMKAMANLEFYEKIAMVENYIFTVKARQNVVVEAIYNDIKAAKQLKKYVNPEIEQKLDNKIQELINIALQDHPYGDLVKRLQEAKEDC